MRSLTEVLIQEFHKMADPLDHEEFDVRIQYTQKQSEKR